MKSNKISKVTVFVNDEQTSKIYRVYMKRKQTFNLDIKLFSQKELGFIDELFKSRDYLNVIIAREIIKSKQ